MITLSIPATRVRSYPDPGLILRTADPVAVPGLIGPEVPERIAFLQLTAAGADLAPLADWGEGLPIDLMLADPAADLPWLYRATPLLDRHPVRVSVPLVPGLARAVRLALALGLPVRLVGHQPGPAAITEAHEALRGYLHNPTVAQPVEPFHGLLSGLVSGDLSGLTGDSGPDQPVRLWSLMECDPAEVVVLDEEGQPRPDQAPASVAAFRDGLLADGAECGGCPWLATCEGYFKWPHTDYDCGGVRGLLAELAEAAAELRAALAEYQGGAG